jgi:hypothetical protein
MLEDARCGSQAARLLRLYDDGASRCSRSRRRPSCCWIRPLSAEFSRWTRFFRAEFSCSS